MNDILSLLVVDSLGAAAIGVLALLAWRLRSIPVAHALALIALIKLVTPPLFDIPIPIALSPRETETLVVTPVRAVELSGFGQLESLTTDPALPRSTAAAPAPADFSVDPATLLVIAWLAGALATAFFVRRSSRRLARLLDCADEAPARLRNTAVELARELGLRECPRIVVVAAKVSPSLFALSSRPTVVLPAQLVDGMDHEEVRAVLAHELCHVANRDHWTRWIEVVVAAVHWWNPIAYALRHLLRECEELRCDGRTVALLRSSARGYGRTILKTTTYLDSAPSALPLGASGFGGARSLKRRLTMIARNQLQHRLSWPAKFALTFCAASMLPLGLAAQERKVKVQGRVESTKELRRMLERIESALDRLEKKDGGSTKRAVRVKAPKKTTKAKSFRVHSSDSGNEIILVDPKGKNVWKSKDEWIELGGKIDARLKKALGKLHGVEDVRILHGKSGKSGNIRARVVPGSKKLRAYVLDKLGNLDLDDLDVHVDVKVDHDDDHDAKQAIKKHKIHVVTPHNRKDLTRKILRALPDGKKLRQYVLRKGGDFDVDVEVLPEGKAVWMHKGHGDKDHKVRVLRGKDNKVHVWHDKDKRFEVKVIGPRGEPSGGMRWRQKSPENSVKALQRKIEKLESQLRELKQSIGRKDC